MTQIKRGDVVLVYFPDSNLYTSKRRPALVVQADNLNTGISQTILAMITSNSQRVVHPSRVVVLANSLEGQTAGLRLDSVVMTDNLVTVTNAEIDSVIGELSDMSQVDAALHYTFGLRPA